MNKLTFGKYCILFFLVLLTSLFLYHSSLNFYFFQDDFFEISLSKIDNFGDLFNLFEFRSGIIDYRPISQRIYFLIFTNIFGLDPVPLRTFNYAIFLGCFLLIYKVITKISTNPKIGLLASSLWVLSSIHFMSLTWISAGYNVIGTFFWLLTSAFFLSYVKNHRLTYSERKNSGIHGPDEANLERGRENSGLQARGIYYILSIGFFLLTIGSFEFSVTWPAIFGFYYLFVLKNSLTRTLKAFFPFIAITVIYLVLRLLFIKIPSQVEYQTTFNIESVKALFWYFLWSLNIPEEFKKQIIGNILVFNPKFFFEFWPLIIKTFLGLLLTLLITVAVPVIRSFRKQITVKPQMIVFGIFWFIAAISPVLVLPNHTFSMYLTLSSIGLYFVLSHLLVNYGLTRLVFPLILIWIATSLTTLSFYKVNSWMIEAQRTARQANHNLKTVFPNLPHYAVVLYPLNSQWEQQALAQNNSIQIFYDDPTLSIYYNKEVLKDDYLQGRLKGPVYVYVPI